MQTLLFFLCSSWIGMQAPCQAWMSTKASAQDVVVTGHCRSLSDKAAVYRYELALMRRGPGGQSSNSQQGRFELQPGQTVTLSEVRINLDSQTSFVGQLRILDAAGQLVAQDSVRHVAPRP